MSITDSPSLLARLRGARRILVKEISAFGAVGLLALGVDLTIFGLLAHPVGTIKAKCLSTVIATTVAYVGNRHLSFSHRARSSLRRETTYFYGINLVILVISTLILALCVYGFDQPHGGVTVQVVNLGTIGIGTLIRFWFYKRFVFLHPDKVHSPDVDLDVELAEE
jgi:putative flippase GtrA